MTTPTGQIGMNQVNVEIEKSSTALVRFNDADVRLLAQVSSGTISMDNMRGKQYAFTYTIPTGTNRNLRTLADAAGYAGQPKVVLTLSGTYTATATSVPAVEFGTWPAGTQLELNITGTVLGYGGAGGAGASGAFSPSAPGAGGAGGPAMRATAITSGSITATISGGLVRAGGGGGGGGCAGYTDLSGQDGSYYYSGGTGGRGAGAQGAQTSGASGGGGNTFAAGAGGSGGTYGGSGGSGGSNGWDSGAGGGAGGASLINSAAVTRIGWTVNSTYWGSLA